MSCSSQMKKAAVFLIPCRESYDLRKFKRRTHINLSNRIISLVACRDASGAANRQYRYSKQNKEKKNASEVEENKNFPQSGIKVQVY